MARKAIISTYTANKRKKRPGIHSKTKSSNSKSAKFYKKSYKGQGR